MKTGNIVLFFIKKLKILFYQNHLLYLSGEELLNVDDQFLSFENKKLKEVLRGFRTK